MSAKPFIRSIGVVAALHVTAAAQPDRGAPGHGDDASSAPPPPDRALVPTEPPAPQRDNARTGAATVHLRQAQALVDARQFDAAIAQFKLSLALVPAAEVQFYLAEAYRAHGDRLAAIGAYNAYLAVASGGPFAETSHMRVAELAAPAPRPSAWKRIVDRPLTLERGQLGGELLLGRDGGWYRPRGQMTGSWELSTRVLVGAGYGINDDLTVGGSYGGGTKLVADTDPVTGVVRVAHRADWGGMTAYTTYLLAHGETYSVSGNVLLQQGIDENEQGVALGLSARYRFTQRLAVFTGNSPVAPTYSSKLAWTFDDPSHGTASISAGLEMQWTRRFYVYYAVNAYHSLAGSGDHAITTSLLTYVTLSEHLDMGAYLNPTGFGLDVRLFQ